MPKQGNIPSFFYSHIYLEFGNSFQVKERSESAARRKIEERLKSYYDKRERVVREDINLNMKRAHGYLSTGLDSEYFACCSRINNVFSEMVLALQKNGLHISNISDISVAPALPSDLIYRVEQELKDDVVEYGGYYSLSKYVEMYANIYNSYEYERGMFGREREITLYTYYGGNEIIREIVKDLQSNMDRNVKSATRLLNDYWQEFVRKLAPEVSSRKATLKQQVEAYKSTLTRSTAASADLQAALTHLDELEKEARR